MSTFPGIFLVRRQWLVIVTALSLAGAWIVWAHCQQWPPFRTALAEGAWQSQSVAGLSLQVPCMPAQTADVTTELPEDVRALISFSETYEGAAMQGRLRLTILHVRYQPGVSLSLDSAAQEALQHAARAAGDHSPSFEISPLEVSGAPARRLDYSNHRRNEEFHLMAVVILQGQQLWEVQVFVRSSGSEAAAKRILTSITLRSADQKQSRLIPE